MSELFSEFTYDTQVYSIFWGIKFDFATSAIVAFIVSLFDFHKKTYTLFASLAITILFLTQISDIFYFEEANRHVGYEIIDIIQDAKSLFMTALTQHMWMTIGTLFCSIILFSICYTFLKQSQKLLINKFFFIKKFIIIILTIFFARGMFQHIPLNPWQSNEIGDAKQASIALNATYNIIYSLINIKKEIEVTKIKGIETADIQESFQTIYTNSLENTTPKISSKPNVIFLFSESWSAIFMQSYGFKHQTTPYFDEMMQNSIRPKAMIANGHRTTEGIFATLTSYQNPLGQTIAKTQLQNYKYDSIIHIFNNYGYNSAFFQGTSKDTSGTGSLVNYLGFTKSFGKRDIKQRIYEENYWGVHDSDLFNFVSSKLGNELKEPFVLGINGATTHDKIVPPGFPTKEYHDNENLNGKLNALSYSDYSLGHFIKEVEEKFPNTVFVLFSDHCGGTISDSFENFLIPFAIYSKQLIQPKYYDKILSQRDIAPTIHELIFNQNNIETQNFTGKSLFSNQNFYADYFRNGVLGWVENNQLIEIDIKTQKYGCYLVQNLKKEATQCDSTFQKLQKRALSFTKISQELLFEGKTQEFNHFKYLN